MSTHPLLIFRKYSLALITCGAASFLLSSCDHLRFAPKPSDGHVKQADVKDAESIPSPVRLAPPLPAPQATKKEPTHTVVVSDVPVRELLFSLARDADLNLDIDNDVDGLVTLNAVNQPLPAILERITANSNLRYSINNNVLQIRKDSPFFRNYRIDYLNMARISSSTVSVSTQISSTGQGAGDAAGGGGSGDNNSSTEVKNTSENTFWSSLQKNIATILVDKNSEAAPSADGNSPDIMLNRESGIMGVRATEKQHQEIQRFIDEVQNSSKRQVLIEATIAEVKLSDRYQAGINWSLVRDGAGKNILFNIANTVNDVALGEPPVFSVGASTRLDGNLLQTTLQALETFGDVHIMSSPKVMAINNQTALLKVVDNLVYFTVEVNVEPSTAISIGRITYETQVNTVPVGFVMSVTPYINEQGSVTLNVRPTISRVIRQARDPNPELARLNVISEIPVIQVREVESVLKVNSGDVAVIGGLMQDEVSNSKRGIPVLSKIPYLGSLFRYEDDNTDKTELVIFIKPIVIKDASLNGDLSHFKEYLPNTAKASGAGQGE